MAFTEDLSPFFDAAGFATEAILTPGGAGLVIYDENGAILDDYGVQHSGPAALCPASQWPNVAIGDTLTIGATTFLVRSTPRIEDGALRLLTLTRTSA